MPYMRTELEQTAYMRAAKDGNRGTFKEGPAEEEEKGKEAGGEDTAERKEGFL